MGEREVQKLQKEVDKLEVNFDFGSAQFLQILFKIIFQAQVLSEKTKLKQMDDDMEGILSSINSI